MPNLLNVWQERLAEVTNFKTLSPAAKIAVMCQTMNLVTKKEKYSKDHPDGWNFFFQIDGTTVSVFSKGHRLLRSYFDFNFKKPLIHVIKTLDDNDRLIEKLINALFSNMGESHG